MSSIAALVRVRAAVNNPKMAVAMVIKSIGIPPFRTQLEALPAHGSYTVELA